ncbi:MAG: hypothetical protein SOX56_11550 [[Pasteurella] mairii]|nr:hypothetical protein [[Pasteurella] mairii]
MCKNLNPNQVVEAHDSVRAYMTLASDIDLQSEFPIDTGCLLWLDDTTEIILQLVRIGGYLAGSENAGADNVPFRVGNKDLSLSSIEKAEQLLLLRQVLSRNYPVSLKECSVATQMMADVDISFAQLQADCQAVMARCCPDSRQSKSFSHWLLSSVYRPLLATWDVDLAYALLLQAILLKRGATSEDEFNAIRSRVFNKIAEIMAENMVKHN